MSQPSQLPPVKTWQAMSLELVAFPVNPDPSIEQNWLEELTGEQGESIRKRNERIDSGTYHGASLQLMLDVFRIRWVIGPRINVDPGHGIDIDTPPHIGPYNEAAQWFSLVVSRWLGQSCPPIKRLAFAGKLVQWTESKESSYETLDRYLPMVNVDPKSSDFIFRVNRPRPTGLIENGYVNRLATWSAIKMEIGMQMSSAGFTKEVGQKFDGCLLQFDFNTPLERNEALPSGNIQDIWSELVMLASELAEVGDTQ